MARLVTTTAGVGHLLDDGGVELLDVAHPDLGAVLGAGMSLAEVLAADVLRRLPADDVQLLAPVPRPPTLWALGWAYRAHRVESGREEEVEEPFFFLKSPTSVVGPGAEIRLPDLAPDRVDYEGEIAVVIGHRGAADLAPDEVLDHIAGYTIANDVSARDVQKGERAGRPANINLAKSFDTFTPLGPCLSTPEELPEPAAIGIRTLVDGEVRQEATTADLIHPLADLIAYLSTYTTLVPGDVVLTGTPAGVGYADGRFLRAGSTVSIHVTGIGALDNPVVRRAPGPMS